jgi:ADP-heptose:LPS heptosyltransferase
VTKKNDFRTFLISRTDSIGDVVLTLPVAGILKKEFPGCKILFLGKTYTEEVIRCCAYVDQFLDWDQISLLSSNQQVAFLKETGADVFIHAFPRPEIASLAVKAGIKLRIGASGRLYHWHTCNGLIFLTRRRSKLHEAQLNIKLLRGIVSSITYSLEEIPPLYAFKSQQELPAAIEQLVKPDKFNLILHPKSKGSAREWGLDNFNHLVEILPEDKFRIFITGTADEGRLVFAEGGLNRSNKLIDLTGKLKLGELITFIDHTDGLIAASTGPLHLAAALNKIAIGIYPPMRPIHPGRWAPLGKNASYFVKEGHCSLCRKGGDCKCMYSIEPNSVAQRLLKHLP